MDSSSDKEDNDRRQEKIVKIFECLNLAAVFYTIQKDDSDNVDHGRYGVRLALHAAMELLKELRATSSQLKPFKRLLAALDDLDKGTTPDLLRPVKISNRPPNSQERNLLKAHAVALVDLLLDDGWMLPRAARYVGNRLLEHEYTVSKKADADVGGVVINWRKNFDLNPEKERRDLIINLLKSVEGSGEDKAKKLLSQLPGIVPVK
jgi:hypothetical protein